MKYYKSIIILQPNINEEKQKEILNDIKQKLEKHFKAKDVNTKIIGKKKLAYDVKGYNEGIYLQTNFLMNPENLPILERNYRRNDDVIKFINIALEPYVYNLDLITKQINESSLSNLQKGIAEEIVFNICDNIENGYIKEKDVNYEQIIEASNNILDIDYLWEDINQEIQNEINDMGIISENEENYSKDDNEEEEKY